jgi:hypothetical protein
MKRWTLCALCMALGLSAACTTTAPISAAKFVKMPQDAPAGKVTATTALVINRPDQGDSQLQQDATPDLQIGGFWTEGTASKFSERYDATVGVVNGVLMYEGNLNLVTGKTRLGILHGVGASFQLGLGDNDQYTMGVPLVAGVFFQHSLSSLKHVYGAARFNHIRTLDNNELTDVEPSNSLSATLGYMMMDGAQGLNLAPELGLAYTLDDNANNLSILLGVSLSANFL